MVTRCWEPKWPMFTICFPSLQPKSGPLAVRVGQHHRVLTANWCSCIGSSHCCVVAKSSLTLCNPMDCSLPGSSVQEILQARILEWVAVSFSRGSSQPRDWTRVSSIGRWLLYHWATRESLFTATSLFPRERTMPSGGGSSDYLASLLLFTRNKADLKEGRKSSRAI